MCEQQMNRKESKKELDKLNINCSEYSLDGSMANKMESILCGWARNQEELWFFENETKVYSYIYNELPPSQAEGVSSRIIFTSHRKQMGIKPQKKLNKKSHE